MSDIELETLAARIFLADSVRTPGYSFLSLPVEAKDRYRRMAIAARDALSSTADRQWGVRYYDSGEVYEYDSEEIARFNAERKGGIGDLVKRYVTEWEEVS